MNNIDFEKLKNEGIQWNKSICRPKLNSFESGAQSRQAEIDELKKELEILQGMHDALSFVAGELVGNKEAALGYLNDIESFGNVKNIEVINKINGILNGENHD